MVAVGTNSITVKVENGNNSESEIAKPNAVSLLLLSASTSEEESRIELLSNPGETVMSTFYFLDRATQYKIRIEITDSIGAKNGSDSGEKVELVAETLSFPVARDARQAHVYRILAEAGQDFKQMLCPTEHTLGRWVMDCKGDWFWTLSYDYEFWMQLYEHALFTLPSQGSPLLGIINPEQRYCIDLKTDVRWDKNKKLRRHRSLYRMTINKDFAQALKDVRSYHLEKSGSTW